MPTYARLPVTFSHGEGAWLWSDEGDKYLDALSGIAVCGLGHGHPAVVNAIREQAGRLLHTSNLYGIEKQNALAEYLTRISGMTSVFFCNSGAEANETAIKLARLYGHGRSVARPTVIVAEGSFHGRTMAALSATGNSKVQAGFEPLLDGFLRVPFGDVDALSQAARDHHNIVAVLLEPIQGEGGVVVPPDDYLAGVRRLCDERDWLMMLDEVQTGVGRTGRWFAWQHENVRPDVMTLAKGLGNGVPIGACLAAGKAAGVLTPGTHGSTFGGNPLACAAALAVLETIEKDGLLERAAALGARLTDGFRKSFGNQPFIREIRGKGLMLAVELDRPCQPLVAAALEEHLLMNVTAERVVRLLPPLIMDDAQADQIVECVSRLVRQHCDS